MRNLQLNYRPKPHTIKSGALQRHSLGSSAGFFPSPPSIEGDTIVNYNQMRQEEFSKKERKRASKKNNRQ
jgi:hypothetical protein